jgi:hypothetical protein
MKVLPFRSAEHCDIQSEAKHSWHADGDHLEGSLRKRLVNSIRRRDVCGLTKALRVFAQESSAHNPPTTTGEHIVATRPPDLGTGARHPEVSFAASIVTIL